MAHLNKVQINHDNLIEIIFVGDQTQETVMAVSRAGKMLADRLRRQGNPVLVLVNLEGVGGSDVNARRAIANTLKEFNYDRIAAYGASKFVEKATGLVVRAIHKEDKIKVFSLRQDAVTWLFGLPSASGVEKAGESEKTSEYRRYVKHKLQTLNDIISLATIGEYAKDIQIPSEEDEFTDTFVGIKLLVQTLEEKAKYIERLQPAAKGTKPKAGKRRVFFERDLPSPHQWS